MTLNDRLRYVPYEHERNYGCRAYEFVYRGLRCVALENEILRVCLVADKGVDIYEFLYKPTDTEFLLHTPLGLRPPTPALPTVNLREGSFLDYYEGGWQELFPAAGDFACEYKGAQLGMHGEVSLLPWSYRIEQDEPERIEVSFSVRTVRTPFLLERRMSLASRKPVLEFRERVANLGDETMDFMWGHHPALGWPFLEEGCLINLPPCRILVPASETLPESRFKPGQEAEWPRVLGRKPGENINLSVMPGPEVKAHDFVFLEGFREGWYTVTNPRLGLGFRLTWPPAVFRYLWFWQVTRGAFGFPWYGTTYCLALEPHSSFPPFLPRAIERDAQIKLKPGEHLEAELNASVFIPNEGTD